MSDYLPGADLTKYDAGELYALLDNLSEYKRAHGRGRSQEAAHARAYCTAERKRVKAELKRRGLKGTRADDARVYGSGKQAWQKGQGA